ncbi:YtxH domain-containing protein [bacterium]|nr:YtxH domain-containing protein [bacterium]
MNKTTETILGVVAGAVVGGALGVLFAPDSGENTRQKIKDKSSDLMDELNGLKTKLGAELSKAASSEKERIRGYIKEIDSYLKDLEAEA